MTASATRSATWTSAASTSRSAAMPRLRCARMARMIRSGCSSVAAGLVAALLARRRAVVRRPAADRHRRRLPARRQPVRARPRRHRGPRPRGAAGGRALQRLLRQRLPDPAATSARSGAGTGRWCCKRRRRAGRRRGVGRVAARHPHRRQAARAGRGSSAGGPTAAPRDGFDAVEFDNLDSFTRSHGLLTRRQAIAYAAAAGARARTTPGSAAGQKNLAGFDGTDDRLRLRGRRGVRALPRVRGVRRRLRRPGAGRSSTARQDFRWTCAHVGDRLAVVLRDRDLSPTGVRRWC